MNLVKSLFCMTAVLAIGASAFAAETALVGSTNASIPTDTNNSTMGAYINGVYLLAANTIRIGFDFNLNNKVSLGVNTQIMPENERFSRDSDQSVSFYRTRVSRFDLGLDSTIMLSGQINGRGAYISPALGLSKITAKIDDVEGTLESPYIEVNAGYQWVWGTFKLAVGGGPVYHITNKDIIVKNKTTGAEDRVKVNNITGLSLDANVGFIF